MAHSSPTPDASVCSPYTDPKSFESVESRLVDTTRLPQPYPHLYVWGATFGALLVTGGGALFSRWLARMWYEPVGGLVHGAFMLLVVGGLVSTLLRRTRDRRRANIERLRIVAECNHHIRNALQVLIVSGDARTGQGALGVQQVAQSVRRIESTLAEILPRVVEESRTAAERSKRPWFLLHPKPQQRLHPAICNLANSSLGLSSKKRTPVVR